MSPGDFRLIPPLPMLNFPAALSSLSNRAYSLPLVVLYVTEGCNFHCISCSYREPLPGELSLSEIRILADELNQFGLRHIAFSGGEPLMRKDFPEICRLFSHHGIKQTLLTNGLLLEKRLRDISPFLHEVIVSIDGATEDTHDTIRGTRSFRQIMNGIRGAAGEQSFSMRTVVQKKNFREIPAIIRLARSLEMTRVSFLTADVVSDAFGRDVRGSVAPPESISLNREETAEFRVVVESLMDEFAEDFVSGFISQSPQKMMHLVEYYEAMNGMREFPRNKCNAPMISAVITSTGSIQPCFFLPSFGNLRTGGLKEALAQPALRQTKADVRAYTLERCHTCVCTSYISPLNAVFDRF